MASVLLGLDREFSPAIRDKVVAGFARFQLRSGFFTMTGVGPAERRGHDEEYFALHCTNYALGALCALGWPPRLPEDYLGELASRETVTAWLDGRDWDRPWTDGNNVVNLASLYTVLVERGVGWAQERLQDMADWHDRRQHAATGLWHTSLADLRKGLFAALAGAAHNLHIYYYLGRDPPHPEKTVDSCLRLRYRAIRSACANIDVLDILVHMRRYEHRLREIDAMLERYLCELLHIQNEDGGFSDNYVTPHLLYGHTTPARVSVTWATWFRLATIGMIACTLLPGEEERWTFRNIVGMGYANLEYALAGGTLVRKVFRRPRLTPPVRAWLVLRRTVRFQRQRATWLARQWLRLAAR